ncbi:sulfurtransferase complex subunit TusD [Vibrio sp. SCSIO 43136]|uniref:sulfurtransferase complex subunit TusD n=1 Tax=Vibrio sp. SCSIO 43136 TaxID=2819101 RepID=UPI002074F897|nr:sulfurtransferase complex subunit TusD [Vibrio sp. SCSIO 43136]USD65526.1 sulfurtransferase complex subunit TusD [Vibrio sp. SCSIO 43136]
MSLSYTLVVNGAGYGSQSSRTALQFANALISQGHTLRSVFFYQDGVSNGSALAVPANDEVDTTKAWQKLAKEHQVRLETCVAAALRRGIVSEDEAQQHGLANHNLAEGFTQAGLGSLAEAMLTQDRVVQF